MDNLIDIRNHNVLVFDIETVNEFKTFQEFKEYNPVLAEEYIKKFETEINDLTPGKFEIDFKANNHYTQNGALYPEYGKVISCSFTTVKFEPSEEVFNKVTKSFKSHNESELLKDINRVFEKDGWIYSGMNLNLFDIPYLLKRMAIHGIKPSKRLINQVFSKPWEKQIIDIADIWAFGGFGKGSRSVKLGAICSTLGINTPKDGVSGPDVPFYYWTGECSRIYGNEVHDQDKALEIIDEYCKKDTEATANCLIRLNELLF